jgi:gamma-glutamyltranspeptidase
MSLDAAVAAPRIHQGFLPDRARFETKRPFEPAIVAALKALGHDVSGKHIAMGDSNDLLVAPDLAYGVADPRGGGLAEAARAPAEPTAAARAPTPRSD